MNKTHKYYIAGPMSGFPDKNKPAFFEANADLFSLMGIPQENIFNPPDLELAVENPSWKEYMKNDIKFLMECDAIVMLRGWENSKGASLEYRIAKELGLLIYDNAFRLIDDGEEFKKWESKNNETPIKISLSGVYGQSKVVGKDQAKIMTETVLNNSKINPLRGNTCSQVHIDDYGSMDDWEVRSKPQTVLQEAEALTNGDRQEAYGHPSVNFKNVADGWKWYLKMKYDIEVPLVAEDTAMLMTLLKISRETHCEKRDNVVDAAGYLNTYSMCLDKKNQESRENTSFWPFTEEEEKNLWLKDKDCYKTGETCNHNCSGLCKESA